jgi:signal transduction histidine kinase
MQPESAPVATRPWWLVRVVLPVLVLTGAAVLLVRSSIDEQALALFQASAADSSSHESAWYFEGVLGRGASYVLLAAFLVVCIACWAGPRASRKSWAYLLACLACTTALAACTPFLPDGVGFAAGMGPNVLAAAGFAWVALYFVGPTAGIVPRGAWLMPGLLLGLLLTSAQIVRGIHPPSSGFWSLTLAWTVAAILAAAFQRTAGAFDFESRYVSADFAGAAQEPGARSCVALSWLAGACACIAGTSFFFLDLLLDTLGPRVEEFIPAFERVELLVTALGLGAAAFFMTEHMRDLRARTAQRIAAEREERFRVLGRMAASVAHEVRNPLHTLRLIVDEQCSDIPELANHSLRPEIESSIERIDRAVDLVYRLARPGSDADDASDLARVTRESVAGIERMNAGRTRVRCTGLTEPAPARGSRVGLGIVIDNLLRNALNASPPGAEVEVALQRRGEEWALEMRNLCASSGAADGIEKERGLGLGLSISRQIAANVGGRIDLVAKGDAVTCTLSWPADRTVDP